MKIAVSRALGPVLSTFLALLAAGCGGNPPRGIEMMPAPAVYGSGGGEALGHLSGPEPLDMLYVTNRAPVTERGQHGERHYSGERGYLLRAGSADIAFGDTDVTWDEARKISLLKNRPGSFPLEVKGINETGILRNSVSLFTPEDIAATVDDTPTRAFLEAIEQRLARSSMKDIFIYVHGYKVIFENPLLVSSELWHFLGYEGAVVAFSWPSTPATFAYMKDIETARVSAWGLRQLLELLARETSARRIHIVGYSAGTRVVLTALHEMALQHQCDRPEAISDTTRLGNVILVGSDVDTGLVASYMLDGLLYTQDRLTFYTSPGDQALKLSKRLFSHRRFGQVVPGSLDERMRQFAHASSRLLLVDVEDADHFDDGNGHAYFRKSPWVSSDILMTLRFDLAPGTRGLEQRDTSPFWRFPADYHQRFETALDAARMARQ
ncbi:alpha/beta hydrolase [Parahaliea mediterranea]|uniref:Alpha/beta hydrolase n=1 Tax=Parahaliea mediterranea TaxID=651086 RepID=A0A939DGY2_9GAMM|nr:alpha/beta hydrolase [Parahaliea mediterranea]MBN7798068.1 alpha/beta hydrolase [Parahaliea mediterranea]